MRCRRDRVLETEGRPRRLLASFSFAAAALLASGCPASDEPEEAEPPAPLESTAAAKPRAAGGGLTTPAMVNILKKQCASKQRKGADVSSDAMINAYATVYRGSGPVPGEVGPPADGVFRIAESLAEHIDPDRAADTSGVNIAAQMFEPLLTPAAGNSEPLPGAAESYEVSEDGRTYTFHLREGLVWNDGEPITAEDFRYSLLRTLSPELASQSAQHIWSHVVGARAYAEGKTTDPGTVGIRVPDDLTLVIDLIAPTPYFPHIAAYVAYAPVPRHVVEAHGDQWVRPENIVVNGPYVLHEWPQRSVLRMKRNPRYWDAEHVAIDKIEYRLTSDEEEAARLYAEGKVYVASPVPPDKRRVWIKEGRGDLRIDQTMCTYYYLFNMAKPPFDDLLVRRAVSRALDRDELLTSVFDGVEKPALNLVPDMFRGTIGYVAEQGSGRDVSAARKLLANAGYPDGVGFPKVRLIYQKSRTHRMIAEAVQRNLDNDLGIELELAELDWRAASDAMYVGDFDIARLAWCADFPDPVSFLELFHSSGEFNHGHYVNPAYDDVLEDIRMAKDPTRRNALFCAAERALNRDRPFVPIYFYTQTFLIRPFVKGFEPQYNDTHLVKYIHFDAGAPERAAPAPAPEPTPGNTGADGERPQPGDAPDPDREP